MNTHNHYLNVSGGRNGTTYNVGLGYIDQPSTMKGFEFKKYTLQFNLNSEVNKRLTFGANVNFNYGDRRFRGRKPGSIPGHAFTGAYVWPDCAGWRRALYLPGDPYVYHSKESCRHRG